MQKCTEKTVFKKGQIYQASFHQVIGGPTLFLTFCNLCRHLHIFLDILELKKENKKKYVEKTVLIIWSYICEKMA